MPQVERIRLQLLGDAVLVPQVERARIQLLGEAGLAPKVERVRLQGCLIARRSSVGASGRKSLPSIVRKNRVGASQFAFNCRKQPQVERARFNC